jgi:photosystem II stability/assembly factor-like uncharacterized protein
VKIGRVAVLVVLTGLLGAVPSAGGLARERGGLFVTQVALHPAKPETVFALTTYAVGLLKSLDRGETWALANQGIKSYSLYQLAIDPRNPNVVYIGAGGGGLYKSVDSGETFAEKNNGLGNTDIGFMVLHPDRPDTIYVVTSTGVYRTPDGGETWVAWNEGDDFTDSQQFQDLVIVRSATPETFLLASKRGVFKRRLGDPAWTLASKDLEGRRISALTVHPDGRRVLAAVMRSGETLSGGGLYVSRDAGSTWRPVGKGLEQDWIRAIRFDPRDARVMYAATSTRGVLKSLDGGRAWAPRNQGLTDRDVRALVVDPTEPSRVYAGTHGAGIFVSTDAGGRWTPLDRVPILDPDSIIASLKARDPSIPPPDILPPPAFAKCNRCHGWTDPYLNQTAHSFWLMPPNRRDWKRTVHRMSRAANLTADEEAQIADFLTRYSTRHVQ